MHRPLPFAALAFVLFAASAAADTDDYAVVTNRPAGRQALDRGPDGSVHALYFYNDRDHGDRIDAYWSLDARGIPTRYSAHGNDYMKAPVDEEFHADGDAAEWRSRHEHGSLARAGAAFYLPANPPPEFYGVLVRALLAAPDHRLQLLPSGEAGVEAAATLSIGEPGHASTWTQYRVRGIDFLPKPVWLDESGRTVAVANLFLSTVAAGHEAELRRLLDSQDDVDRRWFATAAAAIPHVPAGDLLIRHARLFDPRDLSVTPGMSVRVRGERIVLVSKDDDLPDHVEVIDAGGRFLMPGLWDCHQHFDGVDGMLDIANGVTSARDMANDTEVFLRRVARFDAGSEIGPRVIKAGMIDGTGPDSVPVGRLADDVGQALTDVDWYADHGYAQIKLYMSLKPELVQPIADRAHARGLRVSGHVPAFMSARQFIDAGADELQHFNYVELQFLYPRVQETTRASQRFIEVGVHAAEFAPDKAQVRDFIDFLRRRHTTLDPTIGLLEARLAGSATGVTPGLAAVAGRFPPQVRRGLVGGADTAPTGSEAEYREAIPAMLRLLRALHDAGVPILPGTDALAGYMLHHELELYARAGIAPLDVLRTATLVPAQVMGVEKDLGAIAPGKYADMVLIDGDPSRRMADIRNVSTVIKGGRVYDPAAIERTLGIAPRR